MPVNRNLSHVTTPSHSTTSGSQAISLRAADQTDAVAEYSRIGPTYETIDSRRQRPVAQKILDSSMLSERYTRDVQDEVGIDYEFSDTHLSATAAASGNDTRDVQDEVGIDYEVSQNFNIHLY